MLQKMRAYQEFESKDLRMIGKRVQDEIESQLLVIQTPFGYRRVAELFRPKHVKVRSRPYYILIGMSQSSANSNRSQFVEEAKEMARAGAVCLLIETLWSDPDFFIKRTQDDDAAEFDGGSCKHAPCDGSAVVSTECGLSAICICRA